MTREEYIAELKKQLGVLSESEVSDICGDFEEHFSIGLSQGKTEHEISAELGDPKTVADTYLSDNMEAASGYTATAQNNAAISGQINQGKATDGKAPVDLTGARLFVVLFNLLFMVWVAFSIYGTLIGFWAVTAGFIAAAIGMLAVIAVAPIIAAGLVVAALAMFCFALCSAVINFYLTKWTVIGTKTYIDWNKKIYNEGF